MIDTPGFDDTNRSDIDTLKTISTHLSASFVNGVRISGIIYLHRISDNRLGNTGFQNLRMLKKLCGAATWPNTVLGTSGWQSDQHEHGERRELELMGNYNYFGEMISKGAKVMRIAEHGTGMDEQKRSALSIVSYLIQQTISRSAVELEIQHELVTEGKCLDAASAGKEALGDLCHLQCQLSRQLQETRGDTHEALSRRDTDHLQQLQALEEDCKRRIESSKNQQESLRTSLMEMHNAEVQRVQTKLNDMETEQRNVLARKRQELEDMEDSLKRMREQSALDAARWEKQRLDIAALQKRQRANDKFHRECEQSYIKIRREASQQEARVRSISRAKGTMRHQITSSAVNGAANALATAIGTAGKIYCRH